MKQTTPNRTTNDSALGNQWFHRRGAGRKTEAEEQKKAARRTTSLTISLYIHPHELLEPSKQK